LCLFAIDFRHHISPGVRVQMGTKQFISINRNRTPELSFHYLDF
jgi:hypothetical protein